MANKNPWRLDRNVIPSRYFVSLSPNFDDFTFRGLVSIKVQIKEPTSIVTLHASDLDITKASTSSGNTAKSITYNKKYQTVSLEFTDQLRSGTRWLTLEFNGKLNDKMQGFYRTSYTVNGEKRWGAATQFEATDARRAFPCFDEPDMKARFTIQLVTPARMTALSNMPAYSHSVSLGKTHKTVTFEDTLPMSTYLVAFVIAELEYVEGFTKDSKPVRVWATPGKKELCNFALEVALHSIEYFERWFGIPYALPKLDMVALPDFALGAMENWGLITYRETALLIDEKNSSAAARQRVAEVIAHELAHQWFGNLVTMQWWTHLWLNEGFASYAGPKAVDAQFPEWDIWTQYINDDYLIALKTDSLRNTHPIEVTVKNPDEIREIFDSVTYSKGSVVNRMLEHYLGAEAFSKGLKLYFKKYKLGNATTDDLWQTLEDASGKPVRDLMTKYTHQAGYPVLTAYLDEENILYLEQNHFTFDGTGNNKNRLWHIPISIQINEKNKPVTCYMKSRRAEIELDIRKDAWIKINPGQSGFYRVAYSPELLLRLEDAVARGDLPVIDRLALLNDAFALARAGYIKTYDALNLLEAYRNEDNYNVCENMILGIDQLSNILAADLSAHSQLITFARKLFQPIAEAKGWDKILGESHTDILLRSLILRKLGYWGDQKIIDEAKKRFADSITGIEIDADIRDSIYRLVARHGGEKEHEILVSIYESASAPEEKMCALRALGEFADDTLHQRSLDLCLSEKIRSQDKPLLIFFAAGGNKQAVTWEFIKANWDFFLNLYQGAGLGLLIRIIKITDEFSDMEKYKDVEEFFHTHKHAGAKRTVKQCLETIRSNAAWRERSLEEVTEWLEEQFSYRT